MRRFELVEGTASKFWEVEQDGSDLNVRWGRIGTQGQSQTKSFADAAKAASALTRLVNEKTGKGYSETGAAATPAIAATAPATAAPRAAKAPQPAAAAPAPSAAPTPVKRRPRPSSISARRC
ncbi:WGR domain-containing protein [Stenotrophomonas sp. BIGb0135]|uniref:WGR domain-containing protein n=1 Tax=Stenotrophomonas sp. BIGb0135 TaxID=2940620 RepID=UPI002168BA07|nr:WGR domain-containing protein [Stenotrophomonas sp. BIGb0135]